jgi:lipopolysaccharide export system protein LptA
MIRFLFILFVFFSWFKVSAFEVKNVSTRITSEGLTVYYEKNIILYKGKVDVIQKDFNIKCHKMFIYYTNNASSGDKSSLDSSSVEKIEFFDDVILTKQKKVASGDYAIFNPKVNTVTLQGNVTLKDQKSYLKGRNCYL